EPAAMAEMGETSSATIAAGIHRPTFLLWIGMKGLMTARSGNCHTDSNSTEETSAEVLEGLSRTRTNASGHSISSR
ncbi:MAG TPA: hypothetical protein VF518_12725, partial [Polyangia bacterium]